MSPKQRRTLRPGRLPISLLVLATLVAGAHASLAWSHERPANERGAIPYNSEEHKLIVDVASSLVRVPASVRLPASVQFRPVPNYPQAVQLAKGLAVADLGKWSVAQDNCFWYGYAQRAGNLKINVPSAQQSPASVLIVPAHDAAGSAAVNFTIGHLAAFYGDYRTVPFCAAPGSCMLTNADLNQIDFPGNSSAKYCPEPMRAATYLGRVASGLWPPYGSLGNFVSTSAGPTEHGNAAWWGDEMVRIAFVNDWHFSQGAVGWYTGMHRLALLYVDSARHNPDYWVRALHYEANALHSLTDLFAFGHVVTNRDETSHGMAVAHELTARPAYAWMQHVVAMGGGSRNAAGRIALGSDLPALTDRTAVRNAFMASGGSWRDMGTKLPGRAHAEHTYHDSFNGSGALVRNLEGNRFQIYGDGNLHHAWPSSTTHNIPVQAARASLQSLFDAYVALEEGTATVAELASGGSPYFAALKYIPVYIESDSNDYFTGMWTLYAQQANAITGVNRELGWWDQCQIPYLSGADWGWPAKRSHSCADF